NAAGMPFLAGTSLAQRQAGQRSAVGMTRTVVTPLASSIVAIVDLMCDARSYLTSNYSSDGLHPNDAGYAFIAGEVVKAITSSSYSAPLASCPVQTSVPGSSRLSCGRSTAGCGGSCRARPRSCDSRRFRGANGRPASILHEFA